MSRDGAARTLTIIGMFLNLLGLAVWGFTWLSYSMLYSAMYPWGSGWIVSYMLSSAIAILAQFIFGFLLPAVGYSQIRLETKGRAGALLITSGVALMVSNGVTLLLIGFNGPILLIVAGALIASWHPIRPQVYKPLAWEHAGAPSVPAPDYGPPGGFITPRGARFCVACGIELQGAEPFCPACGTPIE